MVRLAALGAAALVAVTEAFYLPGVAPREFADDELVEIGVNKLDSVKTQLPYDYYSLPFCQPSEIVEKAENLGEVLSGDLIETAPFKVMMKRLEACKIVCQKVMDKKEQKLLVERIKDDYVMNLLVDNIPVAQTYNEYRLGSDGGIDYSIEPDTVLRKGLPIGYVGNPKAGLPGIPGQAYVNNHVRLLLGYHEDQSAFQGYRIVSFTARVFSVRHQIDGKFNGMNTKLTTCDALHPVSDNSKPMPAQNVLGPHSVIYTYDVEWEASPIKWASRWDLYLKMTDSDIHWFNIANSIIMVLFMSVLVAVVMVRTLRADLARYNELLTEDEEEEETGWKLIHGDVFRTPAKASFLSVLVGTGCQLLAMATLTLGFALLGMLSPSNRGGLLMAFILLFVFMGALAGYQSTRMFKMFGLVDWKKNTVYTALFFPGIAFSTFFMLNLFVWKEHSTAAVPFGTLVALLVLWLGISAPLTYLGSYFAFRRAADTYPCRINNIPRLVPPGNEAFKPIATLVCGALPFTAVCIEMVFVISSVWQHQIYYAFPVLAVVFFILIIACIEVSILGTYHYLCKEDYHWWWFSFLASGTSAVYFLAFSAYYYASFLEITKFTSFLLYFGYMGLFGFAWFILTGTVGHLAAYHFVHKIYSSVKVD